MHKKTLREIAKFLSGLILGDFLAGWWFLAKDMGSASLFGIQFSNRGIILGMIFDIILIAFLVHYAWRMKETGHTSGERLFHRVAGIIFGIVALAHLGRLIFNLPINLLSWNTPYWVSGIAAIIAGFLSYASFRMTKQD